MLMQTSDPLASLTDAELEFLASNLDKFEDNDTEEIDFVVDSFTTSVGFF